MDQENRSQLYKWKTSAIALAVSMLITPFSVGFAQDVTYEQVKAQDGSLAFSKEQTLLKSEQTLPSKDQISTAQKAHNNVAHAQDGAIAVKQTSFSSSIDLSQAFAVRDDHKSPVSELMDSVWPSVEPKQPQDSLDHNALDQGINASNESYIAIESKKSSTNEQQQVDPFAMQHASFIETLLGGAISTAQASDEEDNFSYLVAQEVDTDEGKSSTVDLKQLWAATPFKLKSGFILEEKEYKQDFISALDRGFSYVSYLFHQNNPYRATYQIPVLFLNDKGSQVLKQNHQNFTPFKITASDPRVQGNNPMMILDHRYTDGLCVGLGVLESDLLGKCAIVERDNLRTGVIVIPELPSSLIQNGIYNDLIRHITPNVMYYNALAIGIDAGSRLAGINSGLIVPQSKKGVAVFPDHLASLDAHIYSTKTKSFIKPGTKFTDIDANCSLTNQKECGFYFVGNDVRRILGPYAGDEFALNHSVTLPQVPAQEREQLNVAIDRFGGGLYTVSSIDLAQILKFNHQKDFVDDKHQKVDAKAIHTLKHGNTNSILVEVEPASLEVIETLSAAAYAATQSFDTTQNQVAHKAQNSSNNSLEHLTKTNQDVNKASLETNSNKIVEAKDGDFQQAEASSKLSDAVAENNESASENHDTVAEQNALDFDQALAKDSGDTSAQKLVQQDNTQADTVQNESKTSSDKSLKNSLSASVASVLAESGRHKNTAAIKSSLAKHDWRDEVQAKFGIPLFFNELGQPVFGLRNTLLSYSDYKNYNFLTEAEMMVLSDLGYSIESAEFYGNSIYASGNAEQRLVHSVVQRFGLYNHKDKVYELQESIVPSAVGLHVYGDFNDIVHSSQFSLGGTGSIGVRIDGSDNYYYQQKGATINVSSVEGSGIAFTYGKNNSAYIGGKIVAKGSKGVAILADMGSNINSDLVEYRGSYIRARSLDYQEGRLTLQEASAMPLLDELNGPQVKDLTISGQVEGSRAAIFIDESSLVRDINVSSKAKITGGIYSIWNPSVDGAGNVKVKHELKRSHLIDAIIQFPVQNKSETKREMAVRELTTRLNLGVKLDQNHKVIRLDPDNDILEGDPTSYTVLDGSINGGSIKVRLFGGRTKVKGSVRAYEIELFDGVLSLNTEEYGIHQLNRLYLHPNAVLDLADGQPSQMYIQENSSFGHRSRLRVDVDAQGNVLDEINFMGPVSAIDYQVRVEPAVSYELMKSLASNPKSMLEFITSFVQKTNEKLAANSLTVRFPRYIWDAAGSYGRELKCSARGCRMGAFVSNEVISRYDNIQPWRYYLAFGGLLCALVVFYIAYFVKKVKERRSSI